MSIPNWWGDWRQGLTPHTGNLQSTDLIECTMIVAGQPVNTVITGAQILGAVPTPSVAWGSITGTLSSQSDLNTALSGKASTGAVTGTGITMSTARILGRSTTGTGAIEEISIGTGLTLTAGTLTASGGGLTVGTTAIASGTIGRVLFQGTGNVLQQSANLFWDNTNSRLGIGTASPSATLHISGAGTTSSTTSFLVQNSAGSNALQITDNRIVKVYNGLDLSGWYLYANGTSNASMFGGTSWVFDTVVSGGYRFRTAGNTDRLRIESTGNVLINTTTDAGYKLDVNGTTRIQSKLSVGTPSAASAVMEVTSTTQGFLPPRMTNAQMLAIATPAAGLVVYDTTNNKHVGYDGTAWQNFY